MRTTFARLPVVTLISVLLAAGCGTPASGLAIAGVPRAEADPADAIPAGAAIDDFGFELLRATGSATSNVVLSPASIVLALAMARAGAVGTTAAEMDLVLRAVASDDHASWLNALDRVLADRSGTFKDDGGKDSSVVLRIANATFAQQEYPWKDAYLSALASRFGAGVRLVDFKAALEQARTAINAWVSDRTEARIPELIERGVLDQLTRMVLVNAIYLKAAWLFPFDEKLTRDGTFTKLDGSAIQVPFMVRQEQFRYAKGDGWQAVEIPYVGGSLAMTIVVPDDLTTLEADLDGPGFQAITDALQVHQVDVALPKFGIETKLDLATLLAGMGMPTAFDPNRADFSGMTDAERLYIAAVIHQANIDVDEKGTTAAAATAVVIRAGSAPGELVELRVDRPFLFALRDLPTGTILFLGHVVEPMARG